MTGATALRRWSLLIRLGWSAAFAAWLHAGGLSWTLAAAAATGLWTGVLALLLGIGFVAGARASGVGTPPLSAFWREFGAVMYSDLILHPWRGNFIETPPAEPRRVPLLLLHGYGCNRAVWLPLQKRLARRGHLCRAIDLGAPLGSIDGHAANIDAAVRALAAATGQAPAVIGHSMGGLAARGWLRTAEQRGDTPPLAALITLGSPHHGTLWARWAPGAAAEEMRPGSRWLARLAAEETARCRHLTYSIWTRHDNLVLPPDSARLDGAGEVTLSGVGHLSLLFDARTAAALETQLDRLS